MACLTESRDPQSWHYRAWFERPLGNLPASVAIVLLVALVCSCIWSVSAPNDTIQTVNRHIAAPQGTGLVGTAGDLELYREINARMARGEGYYSAALSLQQVNNYPTSPFFCVRPPVLAEGVRLFGLLGWQIAAIFVLALSLIGLFGASTRTVSPIERVAAGAFFALCGMGAFLEAAGLMHELIAGLFLSAALLVYRPDRWWPSLLLAALALAVRELALPFLLLWAGFAAFERKKREFLAVLGVIALFAIGMALHAQAVIALRSPDVMESQGWSGFLGPRIFLGAMIQLTPLSALPEWLAPPLALLPLLGWFSLGGRLGWFATLWFAGFALGMALFARPENFYWGMMVLPAYGIGLAFVPRAIAALARAVLSGAATPDHPSVR